MFSADMKKMVAGEAGLLVAFPVAPIQELHARPDMIFSLCAEQRVIHLGCTDHIPMIDEKVSAGLYLHRQLSCVAAECLGVDINREAVIHINSLGMKNAIAGDITAPGIAQITEKHWDWLVMGEMLEHIDNPVAFLQAIQRGYGKYIDKILITVPNAFGLDNFSLPLHTGKEGVNSDHRYWFTPFTLSKVVHQAGLAIDDLHMCVYEGGEAFAQANAQLFLDRPILMNTICLTARWE